MTEVSTLDILSAIRDNYGADTYADIDRTINPLSRADVDNALDRSWELCLEY